MKVEVSTPSLLSTHVHAHTSTLRIGIQGEDTACRVCRQKVFDDEEEELESRNLIMIYCDYCSNAFHLGCLGKTLAGRRKAAEAAIADEKDWWCGRCRKSTKVKPKKK